MSGKMEHCVYIEIPVAPSFRSGWGEARLGEACPLPFYLAAEEWVAARLERLTGGEPVFFLWQVPPTVIVGRNQLLDSEVDMDYCRRSRIAVWRRKSGGGAVYADLDNVMMSYVAANAPGSDVPTTFSRYTAAVAAMLRSLGIAEAKAGGRNDVLIGGCKVSGNAFYHTPHCSIVHGTMLVAADVATMARALTPPPGKLRSKGVASVPARVTTLRRHLPGLTVEEFIAHARRTLCGDRVARLTAADVAEIQTIMQEYMRPEFLTGCNPRATAARHARVEGVGEFDIAIEMNHGVIADVRLAGDFFVLGDIDAELVGRLRGRPLEPSALAAALAGVDASRVIHGLTTPRLIALLTASEI